MSEEHVSVTRVRTWRLWLLPATAVLALGVALWVIAVRSRADRASEDRSPAEDAPIAVQSAVVQYERTPVWYEATGTVRPQFETQLAAKVMGRIVRLEVREGDRVTAGQPLVWLDSRDLRAAVSQAAAGARAARVGVDAASTAARMERSSSAARIDAARALVKQSEAAVAAARSRLDLVRNGPRRQERAQAALAVAQAKAALDLAEADYQRMRTLHTEGAVSKQQLDAARTQWEVARARHAAAVEAASMAEEGSREEDIRAAEEGLRQAQAALDAAREGLRQAEAAALMADVRDQEVRSAREQARQAEAALRLAQTTQDHSILQAPYDGVVARRLADPGNMANPGVPLLTIQGGALRVEAVVPESVLRHVAIGGPASVRLDALGDREISGRVVEISPPRRSCYAHVHRSGGTARGIRGYGRNVRPRALHGWSRRETRGSDESHCGARWPSVRVCAVR